MLEIRSREQNELLLEWWYYNGF